MTNEEKLAEIRQDIYRCDWLRGKPELAGYGDTFRRMIDRLESDLAKLTGPNGKTERRVIALRGDDACLLPAGVETLGLGDIDLYVAFPMPLREVPVVEGEICE